MRKYIWNIIISLLCFLVAVLQYGAGNIGFCFLDVILGVVNLPFIAEWIESIFDNLDGDK